MEDSEKGDLRQVGPEEKVDEHEQGEQGTWDKASTEKWVEEWVTDEVYDSLC